MEVASLADFVNLLKSSKEPHVHIYLYGNSFIGWQWPYVMQVEARMKSGETVSFKKEGKVDIKNSPKGEEMIFANKRLLVEPVEEMARLISMFFPDSKIKVWDLYGKARSLEEFRMHMGI